jgi:hypothetical protein
LGFFENWIQLPIHDLGCIEQVKCLEKRTGRFEHIKVEILYITRDVTK